MTTFNDLVEEVLLNLEGFAGDQDIFGTLAANITNSASSFVVSGSVYADGSGFSTGLIEVGDELIYTQSFDRTTGTFSGCLRGWRGTTATAWTANTLVRNNPRFPRIAVKRAINDTLKGIVPRVSAVKTYEFTFKGGQVRYDMPADCRNVIQVSYSVPGASKSWQPNKRWNFDLTGGSTSATGRALDVWDAIPGRSVQVVYQADPAPLTNASDDFATVTGLPDWARELIVYGACWRLVSFLDAGRVNLNSAEQVMLNTQQPVGSATNLSKYFLGLYQARLDEAEARIQDWYPVARHYIN